MKFLKTRAALSAIGSVVAEKANDVKSNYAEKKDVLTAQAEVERTQAEIAKREQTKAELAETVKQARKLARDAAKQLKDLAQATPAPDGTEAPAPVIVDEKTVVEL